MLIHNHGTRKKIFDFYKIILYIHAIAMYILFQLIFWLLNSFYIKI